MFNNEKQNSRYNFISLILPVIVVLSCNLVLSHKADAQHAMSQQYSFATIIMEDGSEVTGAIHKDPTVGTVTVSRISDAGGRIIDILNPAYIKDTKDVEVNDTLKQSLSNAKPLNLPLHATVHKHGGDTVKGYLAASQSPNEIVIADLKGQIQDTISLSDVIRITQKESKPKTDTTKKTEEPTSTKNAPENEAISQILQQSNNMYQHSSVIPNSPQSLQQLQYLQLMQQQALQQQALQQQQLQQQQLQQNSQQQIQSQQPSVQPAQMPQQNQPIMAQLQLADGTTIQGLASYSPQFQLMKVVTVDQEDRPILHLVLSQFINALQPINVESNTVIPKTPADLGDNLQAKLILINGQKAEGTWVSTQQPGVYSILPENAEQPINLPVKQVPYLILQSSVSTAGAANDEVTNPLEDNVRSSQYTQIPINEMPVNKPAIPGKSTHVKLKTNLGQSFEGTVQEVREGWVVLEVNIIASLKLDSPKITLVNKNNIVSIEIQ